ncbi:MAG: NeuD/PglB/VioB family sugar acetyltransferase [Microlunatus sp.]
MRQVVLVAASGLAREVAATISRLPDTQVAAVLDDAREVWDRVVGDVSVSGPIERIDEYPTAGIVICAGKGRSRKAIARRLAERGIGRDRYVSIIDPSVTIHQTCSIGVGCILLANVVLTCDVRLGDHTVAMPNATLTHDDTLEAFVTVCAGVVLGGGVQVNEAAYLGMGAAVRENATVGECSVLGMGSVLLSDLPANETWAGVPARPLLARKP